VIGGKIPFIEMKISNSGELLRGGLQSGKLYFDDNFSFRRWRHTALNGLSILALCNLLMLENPKNYLHLF
jgi:hypothetical protein